MRDCARSGWVFACLVFAGIAVAGMQGSTDKKTEIRVERKEIPSAEVYAFSRDVGQGRLVKLNDGKPGLVVRTYKITYDGNKRMHKELVKEERIAPVPTRYLMGKNRYVSDRGLYSRGRILLMEASAYPPNPRRPYSSIPSRTASGHFAGFGLAAVDPRVIPLGTPLYIEGYGFALASDTGGAIKGNRIDLCMSSHAACVAFGRRQVKVHVLRRR